MPTVTIEEIYREHIEPLAPEDRLRLLALIARDLADQTKGSARKPKRRITELHGLGAEIWEGVDAQEYVNELRREWDHRP